MSSDDSIAWLVFAVIVAVAIGFAIRRARIAKTEDFDDRES